MRLHYIVKIPNSFVRTFHNIKNYKR